jgi:polyferredoxin
LASLGSDVFRWPVLGSILRWRHARTAAQLGLLLLSVVVILHGLIGPQLAPNNLATVLTWVHYRGLLIVALLAAGNFFCFGCPFVLVRDAGRRFHAPTRRWPRRLRTKWIAVALFVAVLFIYELFDLWALPRGTALLVLGYFAAALAIDLLFSGGTFCKYLCPIGQFNFVASTLSPLELKVRETGTCRVCRTADCIKGRPPQSPVALRGCELGLFLPMKVGNMDCTFCLDCVQACPHDNIALSIRVPGAELVETRRRSGIGRFVRRADIAALAVLFVFGALMNAFGMVAPVYALEQWLSRTMGTTSETPVLAVLYIAGFGIAPLMVVGGAAAATHSLAGKSLSLGRPGGVGQIAVSYAYALVPFGFGMWLAHYGFHLLTGALTVVPVLQSAVVDVFGWPALGGPYWRWAGIPPGAVYPIQLGFILLGTLGSLALIYRISERDYPGRTGATAAPWAIVTVGLAVVGVWILSQPMEMRGLGLPG